MDWADHIREIASGWLFEDIPDAEMPRVVVAPLENPDLHDAATFLHALGETRRYRSITTGTLGTARVGLLSSKLGGPAIAMAVEALAARGVTSIIGVGFCGGLQEHVHCGDLVIPQACLKDDGASVRYVAPGFPAVPDVGLFDLARVKAAAAGARVHVGVVWSTDAPLLQTTELVRHWSSHGVVAVDMECSALFTVAALRRVRAATLLVASDNPLRAERTIGALLSAGVERAIAIAWQMAAAVAASKP